jgi:predicted enzyme related to lactoylglutathione lyase
MSEVTDAPAPAQASNHNRSPSHGSLIWYELMTPDPDGTKTFYDAVVGWRIGEPVAEFEGYRMIGRSDGGFAGGVLPLTEDMQQHGAKPTWLGYICVDDTDAAVAAIEEVGGKVYLAARDLPNVGRIAMVTDPQGAPFYVMKPTPPEGRENEQSDVFSPDAEQRIAWNELSTSDPAAARRFYGEQFGWASEDYMDMGEHGEYRFLDHNGQRIGALSGVMHGQPPHWRYYIRVPSVSAAKQIAEDKGGTIAMGPMEVPGGDHIVIGIDPQGAEFALVGKA